MAINPHDDYEALAKLLYPSIEASGNVYYGQTRKLAIDELFDKNNNGFEAYIDSIRVDDEDSDYGYKYQKCFCWKLGPFNDIILIEESHAFDDLDSLNIPAVWYKYSLTKKDIKKGIIINSASYNTYETEYELSDPKLVSFLDGLLPNGYVYDGRNFFINEENGTFCLYILFHKAPVYENVDKPLYIEALTDDIKVKLAPAGANSSEPNYGLDKCEYTYEYNGITYVLQLDTDVEVKAGSRIYFNCIDKPMCVASAYYNFIITSDNTDAEVAVGGNLASMAKLDVDSEIQENEYYRLFQNNPLITDASKLYIGKIQDRCCLGLFNRCTRLKKAPAILPCVELKINCYDGMFNHCPLENNSIILPAAVGIARCYGSMFSNTDSRLVLVCLLKEYNNNYTDSWLYGRLSGRVHVLENVDWPIGSSGIPEGMTRRNIISTYIEESCESIKHKVNNEKYLVTHGTNNENNGRGDITDPSTLANMEKSFDENNSHPMNTYNADGSFNQEIWGYKSFCSPIQFRNGIYTDDLAVLSTHESSTSDYLNLELNGSIIKSAESEINLINYKLSNGFDADGNMLTVLLTGYDTQEKHVECSAELVTVGNYEDDKDAYTCESYISAATDGGRAWSRINANSDNCSADITTLVNRNGAKLSLSATDLIDGESRLDILPSKSRFCGNPVTAEKWGLSDIIANTLRGIGYMDNGSACTEYGAVGTLGLFRVNTDFLKAGNIIPGDYLSLINMQLNNNSLEITVDTNETMLGTWAALTPVKENSETYNIILAVRIQ